MDYRRNDANRLAGFSHGLKGLLGSLASLVIYPPVLAAWLHRLRGVNIKDVRRVYLSFNAMIDNVFPELVTIGEDVWITRNVCILAHFNPSEHQARAGAFGEIVCKPVVIEDGVFIGVNAVILPGVRVGRGAVVAAGAVVVDDVPPETVVAGNPAKVVRRFAAAD